MPLLVAIEAETLEHWVLTRYLGPHKLHDLLLICSLGLHECLNDGQSRVALLGELLVSSDVSFNDSLARKKFYKNLYRGSMIEYILLPKALQVAVALRLPVVQLHELLGLRDSTLAVLEGV